MVAFTAQTWKMDNLCHLFCKIKKSKLVSESMDVHVSVFCCQLFDRKCLCNWTSAFNRLKIHSFIFPFLSCNKNFLVMVTTITGRLVEANVSPLYRADIPASNGVIHVVDWILKPNDRDWCDGVILPRKRWWDTDTCLSCLVGQEELQDKSKQRQIDGQQEKKTFEPVIKECLSHLPLFHSLSWRTFSVNPSSPPWPSTFLTFLDVHHQRV